MKIVVIGCTHAGTAAVTKAAQLYKDAQITVYERNDNISFLSCGIALYVEGIVKDAAGLFYSSPEKLQALNVKTKMQHEVTNVDIVNKKLQVKDMLTGKAFEDSYDKLIVTTGSWPIKPCIEGINLENVVLCKNYTHAKDIIEKTKTAKNVAVVGAGYIGVELAEAFEVNGKNVTIVDIAPRIMCKYMDKDFTDLAEKELSGRGIKLALGEKVLSLTGENGKVTTVKTDKKEFAADLVVLCIGFCPSTDLFVDKLEMVECNALKVDEYMRTSNPDIVSAGDCCAVYYNPTDSYRYIPLATNAVRMGTLAAINLVKPTMKYTGTQGTSGIKIYDYYMATTGMTEQYAKEVFGDVKSVVITENYRPEFMPTYTPVTLKIVYNDKTKVILGAQLMSTEDYTQAVNTLAVCIQYKMTIQQLAMQDQFFQPHFNKPWNLINVAALNAL